MPQPAGGGLDLVKAPQRAGMRGSKASQAFYAQHEVDVSDAKAKCCSLGGAPELITGFWRGKEHPGAPCAMQRDARNRQAHLGRAGRQFHRQAISHVYDT